MSRNAAAVQNLQGLSNILDDIVSKLHYQVLGNLETLSRLQASLSDIQINQDKLSEATKQKLNIPDIQQTIQALQFFSEKGILSLKALPEDTVTSLVRSPVKQTLGRISGLKKLITQIQGQIGK